MKKSVITLCLFTILTLTVQAQFQIGPKVSMNLADCAFNMQNDDNEEETVIRLLYGLGFGIDYGFTKTWSLQTGLMFTVKGCGYDVESWSDDLTTWKGYDRYSYVYLELPINVAYKIQGFQINAGPYLAMSISGKNDWDYSWKTGIDEIRDIGVIKLKPRMGEVNVDDLDENEDPYYPFDYGFNFGLGYQVGLVVFNAGYSLGLGNMFADYQNVDAGDFRKDNKMSNRVISISVSYMFNTGKYIHIR